MAAINRITRFMEHFWLAVAIGTFLAAVWVMIAEGGEQGRQWLIYPVIALAMFFFRRFTRKRLEAIERHEDERKG
ncbi:MAG: hypothetical protein IPM12_01365 [Flavobacteriales bacterium]|nr:hypothetical protein [Flavobacteriales bacterium]